MNAGINLNGEICLKSRAKINLFLDITGIDRMDGLHFIDSIFQEVTLYDEISIKRNPVDIIVFENADVPAVNTISTALKLFKENFNTKESFKISIFKNIPCGAGLGGGSSNAAAVLSALASLYKKGLNDVIEVGRIIGSDVPYFFTGGLCRIGGKGEIVKELNIKLTNVIFIIVYPNIHISTAWAYSLVNDFKPKGINENNLSEGSGGVDFLKKIVYNKFQFIVFENCQELRDIKEELDGFLDSHLSFMSGSGSSLVFVYSERGKARHDLEILHKKYPFKAFLCKPFYRETKRNARLIEMQECYF